MATNKRLFLCASLLIVVVFALLSTATFASADGDEIQVLSAQAESRFPTEIAFTITATSPNTIKEMRVFFKPYGSERSAYAVLDFEPGIEAKGEYLLSTTGANHTPPGAFISYSFEIRDGAGNVIQTEEKQALYEDSRFEWSEITEDLITVYYYGPVEKRAQTVMDAVRETFKNMVPVLGIAPKEPLRVVTYNNYRHMAAALPFRSQTVREDLETQGMAFNNERVLLVLSGEANVVGIASHEFVHLLVAEATGSARALVPSWLDEGLAEYGNLDPGVEYDRALAYGVFTRRLKPLWFLNRFTGDPNDIIIAYGQSRSVVFYLINVYGRDKMPLLMQAIRETRDIDQALLKVYGFNQHGLDSEWRLQIGLEPFPSPEELAQGRASEPTPTPTPKAEPAPSPTPAPEATPSPEETRRTAGGCSRGRTQVAGATLPLDLSLLALLGAPLALLATVRRRKDNGE